MAVNNSPRPLIGGSSQKMSRMARNLPEDFRGTEQEPVVVPGLRRLPSGLQYYLSHVHDQQGNCLKNRYGSPGSCSPALEAIDLDRPITLT